MAAFCVITGTAFGARPSLNEGSEFTIEKLQRIAGSGEDFTTGELTAEVGQSVEYEIIVTNTSDSSLEFAELEDEDCTGISPAGETELEPGESETFTCNETLSETGPWSNEAEIETDEESQTSNTVYVEVPEEPEFTIEKSQRVDGTEAPFTTDGLTAKLGQTVDYQIVVSNTGNRPLAFSRLSDPDCTDISPDETTELDPDESETFTCQHALAVAGEWSNVAEIEGEFAREQLPEAVRSHAIAGPAGVIKKATSNRVVANVPAEPAFEIEKLQAIKGSGSGFTKAELPGAVGQTVEYEIVVRNTGNVPLALSALADANCTGISPSGATELPVGSSETFTCERVLASAGTYTNEATIEGAGRIGTSNRVTVQAAQQGSATPVQLVQAKCTISESLIVLHGASGSKHRPFTVHIAALGIKQITFYLDGHRLKTLTAAQANEGQFGVRIDPAKVRYGAHRVSVTTVMSQSACAPIARSAVFVHPRPAKIKPKFTG